MEFPLGLFIGIFIGTVVGAIYCNHKLAKVVKDCQALRVLAEQCKKETEIIRSQFDARIQAAKSLRKKD